MVRPMLGRWRRRRRRPAEWCTFPSCLPVCRSGDAQAQVCHMSQGNGCQLGCF